MISAIHHRDAASFQVRAEAEDLFAQLKQAPIRSLADLAVSGPILIIAPHADDETLGCGGLIIAAAKSGIPVLIDILTDGARSHPNSVLYPPERLAALRRNEACRSAEVLGIPSSAIRFHEEPDGYLGRDPSKAKAIEQRLADRIDQSSVSAVFVTSSADPHPDHIAAFVLAQSAVRLTKRPAKLYAYPIWMWAEKGVISLGDGALGAYRFDVSASLDQKRRAVDCYGSQLGRIIRDDPAGFCLTQNALDLFMHPFEVFVKFANDQE